MRAAWTARISLLIISVAGCCSENSKTHEPLKLLSPGQSIEVTISSRCKRESTGLSVTAKQEYSIITNPHDWWVDFFIPCTAAGYMKPWTEWYMRGFEGEKPLPNRPWLALSGSVGPLPSTAFLVSTNWNGSPKTDGELFLFSNDAKGWYWNNFGSVRVTITRTK